MFIWFWLYSQKILQQKLRRDTRAPPAGSSSEPCSSLSHLYADFKKSFLNHSHPVGHSSFFFFFYTLAYITQPLTSFNSCPRLLNMLSIIELCVKHTRTHTHTYKMQSHTFKHRLAHSRPWSIWGCCCWVVIQRGLDGQDCGGSGQRKVKIKGGKQRVLSIHMNLTGNSFYQREIKF